MKHLSKFNETIHVSDETVNAMEETIKEMATKFINFCKSLGIKKDTSSLEKAVRTGTAEEIRKAYYSILASARNAENFPLGGGEGQRKRSNISESKSNRLENFDYKEISFTEFNKYSRIHTFVNQDYENDKVIEFSDKEIELIKNSIAGNYNCITGGYLSDNYKRGIKDIEKFNKKSISINRRKVFNSDNDIAMYLALHGEYRQNTFIGTQYKGLDILVYKLEDEWYIVRVKNNAAGSETFYKCDQIDGLCKLVRNLTH